MPQRAFARVDVYYPTAPRLLDTRGALADELIESGLFTNLSIGDSLVVVQHPLREMRFTTESAGLILRGQETQSAVLDHFVRALQGIRATVATTSQIANYVAPAAGPFDDLARTMYGEVGWPPYFRPLKPTELVDLALTLEVRIDGAAVVMQHGPMNQSQLQTQIFGNLQPPEGFLPEFARFTGLTDRSRVPFKAGGYGDYRRVLTDRLGKWNKFVNETVLLPEAHK